MRNALIDKWNQLKALNIIANDGDPHYIENWYLAAWAYNTGLQPNCERQHHRLLSEQHLHRR